MEANLNTLNNAEQRKKNLQELRNRRKNKLNKRQINEQVFIYIFKH